MENTKGTESYFAVLEVLTELFIRNSLAVRIEAG